MNDPSANIQFFQEKTVRYIGFENLITRSQASYEYPPTATVTHYSTNSTPTTLFFQRGKKLDRQEICQIKNYEKQEPIQARFKPVFLHNTEERNPQHNPFPITTSILKEGKYKDKRMETENNETLTNKIFRYDPPKGSFNQLLTDEQMDGDMNSWMNDVRNSNFL